MKVKWWVEDGYAGNDRPHYTEVPDEDFEGCKTEEEKEEVISEWVRGEFEDKISYGWKIIK